MKNGHFAEIYGHLGKKMVILLKNIVFLVENGYYGSGWAGRIASLMIEKYLKGQVTMKKMEQLVLNKDLKDEYLKPYSGRPFNINER